MSGVAFFAVGPKADEVNDSNILSRLPRRFSSRSHRELMNDAEAVDTRPLEGAEAFKSWPSAAAGMQ